MPAAAEGRALETHGVVLREATTALDRQGIAHVVFGSLATVTLGRRRPLEAGEDIDLLLRPPDVEAATGALEADGFVVEPADPAWIHKAKRLGVTVDLIHRAGREMHLDAEMLERAVPATVLGVPVRLIPPEDLAVIKAVLYTEARKKDWFDALALIGRPDLDWDYLARRARGHAVQRVLSLLLYARSEGIEVPVAVVDGMIASVPG
jgi:hypothetical protein